MTVFFALQGLGQLVDVEVGFELFISYFFFLRDLHSR